MDPTISELLLESVKLSLHITWQDANTDRAVLTWIENGIAYLDDKLGAPGDYLTPGYPRALLLEYVRYARDAALDVFENNYQSLLLAMKNNRLVAAFAAAGGGTSPQSAEPTKRGVEGAAPYTQGSQTRVAGPGSGNGGGV